jgi:hypothetical protein
MLIQSVKWYSIWKISNAKATVIYSTTSIDTFLQTVKKMGLRHSIRSFIFSHVRMTGPTGSIYALKEHLEIHDGDITTSPYEIWENVKDM